MANLKEKIRAISDWPRAGIIFRDITPLLQDPATYVQICSLFNERYQSDSIDKIAAIDARGFIFGAVLAYQKQAGFVPIRKTGKLPASKISRGYSLEYGNNTLELHRDAIQENDRVLLIDDILATGGTATAAASMIEELGGEIIECAFVIELPELKGREKLRDYSVFSILQFDGE